MPHSTFNLKQVAEYLHVPPERIKTLLKTRDIPFEGSPANPVFRRGDIDAWASQRIMGLNERQLSDYHSGSSEKTQDLHDEATILSDLLSADRIDPVLPAKTRASVIEQMADLAASTDHVLDEDGLRASLVEREDLCSTALAGGAALLHPRNHDPYTFDASFMVLGKTGRSIPFGAPDGQKTDLFFLICCDNDRLHLHVLARLCLVFYRTDILDQLRSCESAKEMYEGLVAAERLMVKSL